MKAIIKEKLRHILYLMKKKEYKIKVNKELVNIGHIGDSLQKLDFFYGYYDHSPENNGRVLFHEINESTQTVNIIVQDLLTKKRQEIAKSKAFNWQMGARAIWIDEDIVSYNDFDGEKYVCRWFSLSKNRVTCTYSYPLQDYSKQGFYLGVNYQRLKSYAKEYAYNCLPEMDADKYDDYDNDGIWMVDVKSKSIKLILTISKILSYEHNSLFDSGKHFVNHIMISPDGKSFIFIHRYYVSSERHDRLMYYDFKSLKCLMNGKIQSHYCWLDNSRVFGYGQYKESLGFYIIDVQNGMVTKENELSKVHPKDGHPTIHGEWIVVDGYPDLSRMQSLIAYNFRTKQILRVGDFFHDLKHTESYRCDLHPRFSDDGNTIWIDTIYSGKRELMGINLSKKITVGGG